MNTQPQSESLRVAIPIVVVLLLVGLGIFFSRTASDQEPTPIKPDVTAGWKTSSDEVTGVSFRYPEQGFSTSYITTVDWPPQVVLRDEPFVCTQAGSEIMQNGKTEKYMIGDREYCVTKESEGAAGSIYTNYTYATAKGDKTLVMTFSLRATQCGNYDQPKQSACENERAAFDPDAVSGEIMESVLVR